MFKLNRVRWALRKASLPVPKDALVLDVGSGGKPYPRSDVLLDRLTGDEHRCGSAMLIDGRPTIFGDALKMPFRDKSFDYVVASHILEHVEHPEIFLAELQRVAKAGYIETPNAIFERLFPYNIHCLEIMEVEGTLHIHKKKAHVEDAFLGELDFLNHHEDWRKLFHNSPELFHVRYFWSDTISFQLDNPDVSCEWINSINSDSDEGATKTSYTDSGINWRGIGLQAISKWNSASRKKRLKGFNLESLLACPECKGALEKKADKYRCAICKINFLASPYPNFC